MIYYDFMKVPFKMPEIFPHTLGGGLEIWASIIYYVQYKYIIFIMIYYDSKL